MKLCVLSLCDHAFSGVCVAVAKYTVACCVLKHKIVDCVEAVMPPSGHMTNTHTAAGGKN